MGGKKTFRVKCFSAFEDRKSLLPKVFKKCVFTTLHISCKKWTYCRETHLGNGEHDTFCGKWGPFQQFGPHEDQFLNWGPFQAFRYRIWDLARKLATKAKFKPFGQNQDFFETISRLFCDFLSLFSWKLPQNLHKIKVFKKHVVVTFSAKSGLFLGSTLGHSSCTNVQKPGCGWGGGHCGYRRY